MAELSSDIEHPVAPADIHSADEGIMPPSVDLPDGISAHDNGIALAASSSADEGFGESVATQDQSDIDMGMPVHAKRNGDQDFGEDDVDWAALGLDEPGMEDFDDLGEDPDADDDGEDDGGDRYGGVEVRDAEWESGLTARYADFDAPRQQLEQELRDLPDPHAHPDFVGEGGDEEVPGAMAFRIASREAPEDKAYVTRVAPDYSPSANATIVADRYDSLVRGHNLPEDARQFTEQIVAHDAEKGSITGFEGRRVYDLNDEEWQHIVDTPEVLGTTLNVLSSMFETGIDPDFQGSNLLKNVLWNDQKNGFVMIDYTPLEFDDYSSWDPDDPRVAANSAARDFDRFSEALAQACPNEAGAAQIRVHAQQLAQAYRQARDL